MKKIQLTKGRYTLVDDDDYERISMKKWCYCNGYAVRHKENTGGGIVYMHREIMRLGSSQSDDRHIDHKNGKKLDNRKSNLRLVVRWQNSANSKMHKNNRTGYKGVSYHRQSSTYKSCIQANKVFMTIGYFRTAKEAAMAYNEAAKKYHGEYAYLNPV